MSANPAKPRALPEELLALGVTPEPPRHATTVIIASTKAPVRNEARDEARARSKERKAQSFPTAINPNPAGYLRGWGPLTRPPFKEDEE